MAEAAAIRKQVTDLRPDDLAPYPIWEFALDEEGEEGQDEETVKPQHGERPQPPRRAAMPKLAIAAANAATSRKGSALNGLLHNAFRSLRSASDGPQGRFGRPWRRSSPRSDQVEPEPARLPAPGRLAGRSVGSDQSGARGQLR